MTQSSIMILREDTTLIISTPVENGADVNLSLVTERAVSNYKEHEI